MPTFFLSGGLGRRIHIAAALVLGVVLTSGCGLATGDRSVDDPELPYTFSYPRGFEQTEPNSVFPTALVLTGNVSGLSAVTDDDQIVLVATQPVVRQLGSPSPPTPEDVARAASQQLSAFPGTTITENRKVKVGGLDGVRLEVDMTAGLPDASYTILSDGKTFFQIGCLWREDRSSALDACQEVLDSFQVRTPEGG